MLVPFCRRRPRRRVGSTSARWRSRRCSASAAQAPTSSSPTTRSRPPSGCRRTVCEVARREPENSPEHRAGRRICLLIRNELLERELPLPAAGSLKQSQTSNSASESFI
eukprot:6208798-Pleurochrysis_carterae.AAC.2